MILYHGTITQFAAQIKREGLKPNPAKTFSLIQTWLSHPIRHSEQDCLYLTASRDCAETFAQFRAKFERTPYNGSLNWLDMPEFRCIKKSREVIPDAKPCILSVTVTDASLLLPDDHSAPSWKAYRYFGSIPSSAIRRIETL